MDGEFCFLWSCRYGTNGLNKRHDQSFDGRYSTRKLVFCWLYYLLCLIVSVPVSAHRDRIKGLMTAVVVMHTLGDGNINGRINSLSRLILVSAWVGLVQVSVDSLANSSLEGLHGKGILVCRGLLVAFLVGVHRGRVLFFGLHLGRVALPAGDIVAPQILEANALVFGWAWRGQRGWVLVIVGGWCGGRQSGSRSRS